MANLVIGRRVGESFLLDTPAGPVWCTVIRITRHRGRYEVRLGFEADRAIPIERDDMLKPAALKPQGEQPCASK